ncbi:putative quinol monooxygenase [Lysinimonas soli]|uniref:Quinol monooxygenase n=1 Tax=Lysinimonas soli TaxID=1074233 RepID=A0ABW0NSZ1_9MICO
MNPRRVLYAEIVAAPGRDREVRALLSELTAVVRAEPGNVLFEPSEREDRPGHFFVYEEYRDAEAFAAHIASEASVEFNRRLGPLVEGGASRLTRLAPLPG